MIVTKNNYLIIQLAGNNETSSGLVVTEEQSNRGTVAFDSGVYHVGDVVYFDKPRKNLNINGVSYIVIDDIDVIAREEE